MRWATATVEASPGSYQAWIKVFEEALAPQVRRIAAEALAQHYDGQPGGAGGSPYGRLAGFTNQAPEHARDGRQPYVLAHECPGKVAEKAPKLLERIEQTIDQAAAREERQRRLEGIRTVEAGYQGQSLVQVYRRQAQRYLNQHGFTTDFARMDEAIATELAKNSRFTLEEIERGIREASPNVESRRVGHMEGYAKRTAEKAWEALEVQQRRQWQRQQQERQPQRGRNGPSRGR